MSLHQACKEAEVGSWEGTWLGRDSGSVSLERWAAGFEAERGTEAEADLLPSVSFLGLYPENKKPGEAWSMGGDTLLLTLAAQLRWPSGDAGHICSKFKQDSYCVDVEGFVSRRTQCTLLFFFFFF